MLGTIRRSGEVMSLFTADAPEWGVREVSRALGVPKTNVHSVLTSLADIGMLERTDAARYRLGWRILTMGRVLVDGAAFRPHALAAMRRVAVGVSGTATLWVPDRHEAICIGVARSPGSVLEPMLNVGMRVPLLASAAGRALAAQRPRRELRALLVEPDGHFAELAEDRLHADLAEIREQGFSCTESLPGTSGFGEIAVALHDARGGVVASMAVTGTCAAIAASRQQIVGHLVDAAAIVRRRTRASLDSGAPSCAAVGA